MFLFVIFRKYIKVNFEKKVQPISCIMFALKGVTCGLVVGRTNFFENLYAFGTNVLMTSMHTFWYFIMSYVG